MEVKVELKGTEHLVVRFSEWPGTLRQQLSQAIGRETFKMQAAVKEKLSGQVLKNQTGRLRNSISASVDETANSITGTVGTNVEYAAVHEYGFQGTVNVREYMRRAAPPLSEQIKGGTIRSQLEGMVTVRAHTREMNMPQRSFLRSTLADSIPSIKDAFKGAVDGITD